LVMDPFSPCTVTWRRVFVAVLMVTDTDGPEPAATATPEAPRARTIAPRRAIRVLRCMRATPFHEGCWLCGRKLASWLSGLPLPPWRVTGRQRVACLCGRRPRSQWRVRAGFPPASHRHRPRTGQIVPVAVAMWAAHPDFLATRPPPPAERDG